MSDRRKFYPSKTVTRSYAVFQERGVDNVSLLPIFEPTTSPRNFVIVATKKGANSMASAHNPAKEKRVDKIPPGV